MAEIGSFHVGGEITVLNGLPLRGRVSTQGGPVHPIDPNGEIMAGQMYVQYVRLANLKREDLDALDDMRCAAMPPRPQVSTEADDGAGYAEGSGGAENDAEADGAPNGRDETGPSHEDNMEEDESRVPQPTAAEATALSDALLVDLHAARTVALRL